MELDGVEKDRVWMSRWLGHVGELHAAAPPRTLQIVLSGGGGVGDDDGGGSGGGSGGGAHTTGRLFDADGLMPTFRCAPPQPPLRFLMGQAPRIYPCPPSRLRYRRRRQPPQQTQRPCGYRCLRPDRGAPTRRLLQLCLTPLSSSDFTRPTPAGCTVRPCSGHVILNLFPPAPAARPAPFTLVPFPGRFLILSEGKAASRPLRE